MQTILIFSLLHIPQRHIFISKFSTFCCKYIKINDNCFLILDYVDLSVTTFELTSGADVVLGEDYGYNLVVNVRPSRSGSFSAQENYKIKFYAGPSPSSIEDAFEITYDFSTGFDDVCI